VRDARDHLPERRELGRLDHLRLRGLHLFQCVLGLAGAGAQHQIFALQAMHLIAEPDAAAEQQNHDHAEHAVPPLPKVSSINRQMLSKYK